MVILCKLRLPGREIELELRIVAPDLSSDSIHEAHERVDVNPGLLVSLFAIGGFIIRRSPFLKRKC